jgi:hypothetical protein
LSTNKFYFLSPIWRTGYPKNPFFIASWRVNFILFRQSGEISPLFRALLATLADSCGVCQLQTVLQQLAWRRPCCRRCNAAMQAQPTLPLRHPTALLDEFYHRHQKAYQLRYIIKPFLVDVPDDPTLKHVHWRCWVTCPAVQFLDKQIPESTSTADAITKEAAKDAAAKKAWDAIQEYNVPVKASADPYSRTCNASMQAQPRIRQLHPRTLLYEFYHIHHEADHLQYKLEPLLVSVPHVPLSRHVHWRCSVTCPALQFLDKIILKSVFTAAAMSKEAAKNAAAETAWDAIQEYIVPVRASRQHVTASSYVGSASPIARIPEQPPQARLNEFYALGGKAEQVQYKTDAFSGLGRPDPFWSCQLTCPAVQSMHGCFPVFLDAVAVTRYGKTEDAAKDAAAAKVLRIVTPPSRSPPPSS